MPEQELKHITNIEVSTSIDEDTVTLNQIDKEFADMARYVKSGIVDFTPDYDPEDLVIKMRLRGTDTVYCKIYTRGELK